MTERAANTFVIVGGGTAGWMAAATLSRLLLRPHITTKSITLVESEEIATVGVGEATIPSIQDMLRFLNIDETDFLRDTDATFKLGIRFDDWNGPGSRFWHPFGELGPTVENLPLFQHWLRERLSGSPSSLSSLSIAAQMAEANRFAKPGSDRNSPLIGSGYAYHFDAAKVAQYLRGYAEHKGVLQIKGHIVDVRQDDTGAIASVTLKDGRTVNGDFFIDCSGFSGLLIEKTLGSAFEDWSHWLPCDRAVAIPTKSNGPLTPYTVAQARDAGWTWRIPLRSRTGNGYVWSSRFSDEAAATSTLMNAVDSEPLAEPRHLRFVAGRRKEPWLKNCLSLGLASGFLEPLESTSIHLIFSNLFRFFDHFPHDIDAKPLREAFNTRCTRELEEIRDFLILHYCTSKRRDTPFWRYVTDMELPDSLETRMEAFRSQGKLLADYYDLFKPGSWMSIYVGMGVIPKRADPLAELIPADFSRQVLANVTAAIQKAASLQPSHETVLKAYGQQSSVT